MDRLAVVDLKTREVRGGRLDPQIKRKFLGGRGVNTYLLYHLVDAATDPMNPERNPLIVGVGMLTGIQGIANNRVSFSAKSPETGHLGDSCMGGYFGPELRFAGFDHLILINRADKPTYLYLHDGKVEFRDASHLARLDVIETQEEIRRELGDPKAKIACIGPAGRKLVRFANIMHETSYAAGRTGMGCVMGTKNLWALVARGPRDIEVTSRDRLRRIASSHTHQVQGTKGHMATSIYGTLIRLNNTRTQGFEGGYNHQYNMMEAGGEELDADVFLEEYESGKGTCYRCPTRCKHLHDSLDENRHRGRQVGGPEYYGAGGWGSQVGNGSWKTILDAWDYTTQIGVDVGSATAYTGWIMELYQRGMLSEEDCGLKMEWGSREAVMGILYQIMSGEGIGGLLAGGWRHAARVIGKDCERYLDHVKGLTIECDDVRAHRAQALGLATSSRGADHLRSRYTLEEFALPEEASQKITGRPIPRDPGAYEGKDWACFWTENICSLADALGICKFQTKWLSPGLLGIEQFGESIEALTGARYSYDDLIAAAERIYNMERLFLVREGFRRKDDTVPEKFLRPWTHGPKAGDHIDPEKFQTMLDGYYDIHGWDREGIPTDETLTRLGLTREADPQLPFLVQ